MTRKINDGMNFIEDMDDTCLDKFINEMCENLDPDFNIKKITSHKYEFQIKQYIYNVDITESIVIATNKKILTIKFKLMNGENQPKRDDFVTDQQYNIALQKSQIGITGTGNSTVVFKKVIGAIITALKDSKPNYITFSADEDNRRNLYGKIIKTIEKYIPVKYKQLDHNPVDNCDLNEGEFWLEIL